jgi:hypothetical protein
MPKAWNLEEAEVIVDVGRDLGNLSVVVDGTLCWDETIGL